MAHANRPAENLYFYIPDPLTSYGLTVMQHQLVNDIRPQNIITDTEKLFEILDHEENRIVILDDVSLSGSKIQRLIGLDETDLIFPRKQPVISKFQNNKDRLIIAPLIATEEARHAIQRGKPVSFITQDFIKSVTVEDDSILADLLGENINWDKTNTQMVLPYMAPDNNTLLFNATIAPYYTLNGSGVKMGMWSNQKYVYPHKRAQLKDNASDY